MLEKELNNEIKRLKQVEKEAERKKREEEKARKQAAIDELNKRIADIKKLARDYADVALEDKDTLIKVTKNILLDGKNFEFDVKDILLDNKKFGLDATCSYSKINPELLKNIFDRIGETDFMLHFIDGILESILDKLDMRENFYIHHRFVDIVVSDKDHKHYRTFSCEEQGKIINVDEFGWCCTIRTMFNLEQPGHIIIYGNYERHKRSLFKRLFKRK